MEGEAVIVDVGADVARLWLAQMAAKGVTVTLVKSRLRLSPARAYQAMSDEQLLTLRHQRAAIVALLRDGGAPFASVVASPEEVEREAIPEPAAASTLCAHCRRPTVDCEARRTTHIRWWRAVHHAHQDEARRRDDEKTAEMKASLARKDAPRW